jgi:hypothetical protein
VIPKHRRSDQPSLASVGAPLYGAEFESEALGYSRAIDYSESNGYRGPTSNGYRSAASNGYRSAASNGYPSSGYHNTAAEPDWGAVPEAQDWQNWGPPPALYPDHPSAPVPRVQLSADHPSGPMPVLRGLAGPGPAGAGSRPPASQDRLRPLPPDAPPSRGPAAQPLRGPARARNSGRHAAFTSSESGDYVTAAAAGAAAGRVRPDAPRSPREAGLPRRDSVGYQRQPGQVRRDSTGYQRGAAPGWQETTDYRRETGPFGPGPGQAGQYQNGRSQGGDSLYRTGPMRAPANGNAVRTSQEAHDNAAAIREAAELQAATITQQATGQAAAIREAAQQEAEAAQREAAELRARLEAMLGELGRTAPRAAGSVAAPARPASIPALPGAEPGLPRRTSARPAIAPARPGAEPGVPQRTSARPAAKPTRPDTRPGTRPGTRPAAPTSPRTSSGASLTHGRQSKVFRAFVWGTAGLVAFATLAGATEIAQHGFGFFAFRAGGFGETPGSITDQQFEAHEVNIRGNAIPKAHTAAAPTGKHHKTSS